MGFNRWAVALVSAGLAASPLAASDGDSACPVQNHPGLQFVEVFDGKPEDQAILVPDVAGKLRGHWDLGPVYEAGRVVTLRCKYLGGTSVDVTLERRTSLCSYAVGKTKVMSIRCR